MSSFAKKARLYVRNASVGIDRFRTPHNLQRGVIHVGHTVSESGELVSTFGPLDKSRRLGRMNGPSRVTFPNQFGC